MGITGEVKLESLATVPPAPNAALSGESTLVVVVTQSAAVFAATLLLAVVQPAGKAGAVTPSKFSVKVVGELTSNPSVNVILTFPRSRSPSCRWNVKVMLPPQVPLFEKWKSRKPVAPEATTP